MKDEVRSWLDEPFVDGEPRIRRVTEVLTVRAVKEATAMARMGLGFAYGVWGGCPRTEENPYGRSGVSAEEYHESENYAGALEAFVQVGAVTVEELQEEFKKERVRLWKELQSQEA